MDSVNFEDFIPTYPEDSNPDIQHLITVKNEFLEVAGTVKEAVPKRGQYYKHQKALFRYMLYHDRMLNIQETGTGKTCSLVAIAEYYNKFKESKEIRHVYVLEKGSTTIDEFKKQIACKCTPEDNEYITKKVTDITLQERHRKGNLTRSLNKWYTVKSYGVFASEIEKRKLTDEQLEREFSGCIFFVDEAHNLSEDKSVKRREKETQEKNEDEVKQEKEKRNIYDTLWRLFHVVKRSKIILGTATPMINEVDEIAPLMNLILPIDQQMPTEGWNYQNVTLEQLEPFFRGKVSYVRGLDTSAQVIYQGDAMDHTYQLEIPKEGQKVPFLAMVRDKSGKVLSSPVQPKLEMEKKEFQSQSIIKRVVMSKFQKRGYDRAAGEDSSGDVSKKEAQAFKFYERSAASFVFPDLSYAGDFTSAKAGALENRAGKFIKPEKTADGKRKPNSYKLEKTFKDQISVMENLRELSAKYAFIIENELKEENFGNAFCFSELVTGSGVILFGKILEEYGFSKYKESSSVFQTKSSKTISICSGDSDAKSLKSTFQKGLRYGILSKDMSDGEQSSLLELFNSYENRNGEYCKILLGTPIARDGINVFNVRRGYLMTPMWHPSGMHQALSRFIRSTSHEMLVNDERKRLESIGMDPSMATIIVKIYKMAAVTSPSDQTSVDLQLYQITERKDIHIRRMMRFLKQCAFDCPIHYGRNVRPGDIDGSATCDYMECKYYCFPSGDTNKISPGEVEFDTYDILYSDEVVQVCRDEIIRLMKTKTSVSIGYLYSYFKDLYKKKFVNAAVDSIINDKLSVRDRFGYTSFLNSNGILLYNQGDLLTSKSLDLSDLSYYKDLMFGMIPTNFDKLIGESAKEEQSDILDKILALKEPDLEDYEMFDTLVNSLTESMKIKLLEQYLPELDFKNRIFQALIRKFRNYIIISREPKEDIQKVKKYLDEIKLKPGRERQETDKPVVDIKFQGPPPADYVYPDGTNPKDVIILTYSEETTKQSSYNAFANFINANQDIRINVSNEGWRKTTKYEYPAYNNIVKMNTKAILDYYDQFDEYGSFLLDNKFRIQRKFINPKGELIQQRLVCTSYKEFALIQILLKYNYSDPVVNRIEIPKKLQKKDAMITFLLESKVESTEEELNSYSLDDLYYIYRWMKSKYSKEEICQFIQIIFGERNLIFVL